MSKTRVDRPSDISEMTLTELRARLARAERLAIVGELAATAAHEIKNPLAPIRGYAQMLSARLEGLPASERPLFERGLAIIKRESERIDRRIARLLDLARADRPIDASAETLELNRVVAEAAALAEGEPRGPRIVQTLDRTIDRVAGIEDDIRSAVVNLLKNAVEAMAERPGGVIEVITRREGGQAIVEIKDEGPGIDPAAAERVFELFFTTKSQGTGLGLAIARSAVEAAGGSISLLSRADRAGAVARIELLARRPL